MFEIPKLPDKFWFTDIEGGDFDVYVAIMVHKKKGHHLF